MISQTRPKCHVGIGSKKPVRSTCIMGYGNTWRKQHGNMNDKISTSSLQAIELFKSAVKPHLHELLNGEIFSVEEEAHAMSPTARALDMYASTDLAVRYQTTTAVFLAASRLLYSDEAKCSFPFSLTLRNSVNGSYEVTELNKLQRAVSMFQAGTPVVLPRYLCYARIFPKEKPSTLYDLLAVETTPLIQHVFSPLQLNLPELRRQKENPKNGNEKDEVPWDKENKQLAGIRNSESNTFVYISKKWLDMHSIPYLYKKVI